MVFDAASAVSDLQSQIDEIKEELGITPGGVYSDARVRFDILEARINNPYAPAPNVDNPFIIGDDGVTISTGNGFPTEDKLPGSLYLRKDGYSINGLYAMREDGYWHSIDTDLSSAISSVEFATDDDYTAIYSDYQSKIMEFSGTISVTRNVFLPNLSGYQWTVFNNTTGGQSINLLILGQTGITVANNKRAIIYCNGTDIVRVTSDT